MLAVPALTPLTSPDDETVATKGVLVLQVTALLVAFDGVTVAVSCRVPPTSIDAIVGSTLTVSTATAQLGSSQEKSVAKAKAATTPRICTATLQPLVFSMIALVVRNRFFICILLEESFPKGAS